MNVLLLPRLTALGVSKILGSAGNPMTAANARALLEDGPSMLSFAPSGGHRSDELAESLGASLREIATKSGFPDNASQIARSMFDHEAAVYLASQPELCTGELLRDDVWSYLAAVVLPDVVAWRYPEQAPHRFAGGVRNALQRLWSRGMILDRGQDHPDRWGLVRALTEDAAVQIFERASIGGNKRLAVALSEGWIRMAAKIGRGNMEPVMRLATKLVRLRNEIIDLAGLPDNELEAAVTSFFDQAWASVKREGRSWG